MPKKRNSLFGADFLNACERKRISEALTIPTEYGELIDIDTVRGMINGGSCFDQSVAQKVIDLVQGGAALSSAAKVAGVSYSTVAQWRADRPEFAKALEMAEGQFKYLCENRVAMAMEEDWKSAAWILERRFAEEYMSKQRTEAIMSQATDEFMNEVITILEKVDVQSAKELLEKIQARIIK